MCTTTSSAFSKSSRASRPSFRHKKRSSDVPAERRPVKKVSFSKRDNVLGRAQDYDRTSFEVPLMLRRRRAPAKAPPQKPQETPVTPILAVVDDERKPRQTQQTQQQQTQPQYANFSGMWRRSHGFNWASLLLFSGVDEAAIADQVRTAATVVGSKDILFTSFSCLI